MCCLPLRKKTTALEFRNEITDKLPDSEAPQPTGSHEPWGAALPGEAPRYRRWVPGPHQSSPGTLSGPAAYQVEVSNSSSGHVSFDSRNIPGQKHLNRSFPVTPTANAAGKHDRILCAICTLAPGLGSARQPCIRINTRQWHRRQYVLGSHNMLRSLAALELQ